MAFRYLKILRPPPLASTRLIVKEADNKARSYAGVMTIPIVSYKHLRDVPSEEVLSRLNIFELLRDVSNTHTEKEQGLGRGLKEAERQEGKNLQTNNKRNATGDVSSPTNGEGRSGDWTAEGQGGRMATAVWMHELGQATRRWCLSIVAHATENTMVAVGLKAVAVIADVNGNNIQHSSCIPSSGGVQISGVQPYSPPRNHQNNASNWRSLHPHPPLLCLVIEYLMI